MHRNMVDYTPPHVCSVIMSALHKLNQQTVSVCVLMCVPCHHHTHRHTIRLNHTFRASTVRPMLWTVQVLLLLSQLLLLHRMSAQTLAHWTSHALQTCQPTPESRAAESRGWRRRIMCATRTRTRIYSLIWKTINTKTKPQTHITDFPNFFEPFIKQENTRKKNTFLYISQHCHALGRSTNLTWSIKLYYTFTEHNTDRQSKKYRIYDTFTEVHDTFTEVDIITFFTLRYSPQA